jgi:hypothetical protein
MARSLTAGFGGRFRVDVVDDDDADDAADASLLTSLGPPATRSAPNTDEKASSAASSSSSSSDGIAGTPSYCHCGMCACCVWCVCVVRLYGAEHLADACGYNFARANCASTTRKRAQTDCNDGQRRTFANEERARFRCSTNADARLCLVCEL